MIVEIYDALRAAGVDDDRARLAAKAVIGVEDRANLAARADLAEMESRVIKWCVGTMIAMTASFAAIVNSRRESTLSAAACALSSFQTRLGAVAPIGGRWPRRPAIVVGDRWLH